MFKILINFAYIYFYDFNVKYILFFLIFEDCFT